MWVHQNSCFHPNPWNGNRKKELVYKKNIIVTCFFFYYGKDYYYKLFLQIVKAFHHNLHHNFKKIKSLYEAKLSENYGRALLNGKGFIIFN